MFDDFDMIYSYSRAQAIADGMLIDITDHARERGFKIPVALTVAVWTMLETIPEDVQEDIAGRLHDVLSVLLMRIYYSEKNTTIIHYTVSFQSAPSKIDEHKLKAICGPGDNAEPVITIMFPNED